MGEGLPLREHHRAGGRHQHGTESLTEIGFENAVLQMRRLSQNLRESGKTIPGKGAIYQVKNFNYGLIVPGEGRMGTIGMQL